MLGFMIKKAFFDFWDNLFTVLLINAGFIILLAILFYLLYVLKFNTSLFFLVILSGFYLINFYMGVASQAAVDITDYKQIGFKDFFGYFKGIWKPALAITLIEGPYLIITAIAAPFYILQRSILGTAGASVMFWITLILALALQYYYPIYRRLDKELGKVLKKCFLVLFDNIWFSVYMLSGTVAIVLISSLLGFILPGIGGVFIWINTGFKLRLLKYDYIEAHPETDRRKIPWNEILSDEKENVGKRSLRGMIFPWKDK